MRATTIEQDEQVRLAFGMIDFITQHPSQPAATKVGEGRYGDNGSPEIDAERIAGYEDTIREYTLSKTRYAVSLASLGRASDAAGIGDGLTTALTVARQDTLMGHEKLAVEAQKIMYKTLTDFSDAFAGDCKNQSFDVALVWEIERKNQSLGTGITVLPCARRKYIADLDSQDVHYHIETCTLDGLSPWTVQVSGLVTGSGEGFVQHDDMDYWSADTVFEGHSDTLHGSMRILGEEKKLPAPPSSRLNPASRGHAGLTVTSTAKTFRLSAIDSDRCRKGQGSLAAMP